MVAKSTYKPQELKLPTPDFDSELTALIMELEQLRRLQLHTDVHPVIFKQLKNLFHTLEGTSSARIEGNNTTISEYIQTKLEDRPYVSEEIEEIRNIERAMQWIDEVISDYPINRAFISKLHQEIVNGLSPPSKGEGDRTPGEYRTKDVQIQESAHTPPPHYLVPELMDELVNFIADETKPNQYNLLRVAVAHHRFMWIHPFTNGNGRVGRLLTYAMLIQQGFNIQVGRIINPTAVFCLDRGAYYDNLALADKGDTAGLESWCQFVLSGLLTEITKILKLADKNYVQVKLMNEALAQAREYGVITQRDHDILKVASDLQTIQSGDISDSMREPPHFTTISRWLKSLRDKKMLIPETDNSNKYHLNFVGNKLTRFMILALEKEGYVPFEDEDKIR